MMRRLFLLPVVVAATGILLAPPTASAVVTTIDFEGLADFTSVDNQFLGLGVDFNGSASVLTLGVSLSSSFPPNSGTNVIFDDPTGTIRADSVGLLWDFVGGYVTGNTNVVLTAFDVLNNVLGTSSTGGANFIGSGGPPPNIFLSVNASNIAYATFTDSSNTFTVDDFQFQQQVPTPTAAVLALIGLGMSGRLQRRRCRNA